MGMANATVEVARLFRRPVPHADAHIRKSHRPRTRLDHLLISTSARGGSRSP